MIIVMRKIIKTNDLDDIEYLYICGKLCDKNRLKWSWELMNDEIKMMMKFMIDKFPNDYE
jgi:hypothetical protein